MKVYVGILLFKIVVCLCILKPLFILINIVLSVVLIVLIPVWTTILVLLRYVLDIHLFNNLHEQSQYYLRQVHWFPLLRNIIHIFLTIIVGIFMVTVAPLFQGIFAIIVTAFSFTRFYLRTCYDWLMFRLISRFGRSPVTDSAFAWRIEGPGISSTFFQSIKSSDIYLLVAAELEKIHLEIFQAHTNQKLASPQSKLS